MTIKILSLNLNGLRSAARKGLFSWLHQEQFDVICLQEIRCQADQLVPEFTLSGYHAYFSHAQKKGYSGVGIYTRWMPEHVIHSLGWKMADEEGRYLQLDFKELSIASIYFPSGTSGAHRQACKFAFLAHYQPLLEAQRDAQREYILCGDFNIAHHAIDLKHWRSNQTSSGFLPEERAWLDELFGPIGYTDAFRALESRPNHYTWWSYRGHAWDSNAGWRIDYQVITPGLKETLRSASIYKAQRFSDHAPLIIEYDIMLHGN